MGAFFKNKSDIILRVGVHISNEVQIVDCTHEIIFEIIKLIVNFLFQLFQSDVKSNMTQTIHMVDLITVDKLWKFLLLSLHLNQTADQF